MKRNWTCCLLPRDTMSLRMFSLTCPLISDALPPTTGSWQSPAQDSNIFKSALGTHFAKLNHCEPYNIIIIFIPIMIFEADEFMRFVVASWRWWGVLVQPTSLIDSSNDSCRPSRRTVCFLVSCTGAAPSLHY